MRRADAGAAQAAAEQEIARRGLVAGVTTLFYASLAADHKVDVAEQARQEAADFTKLTTEREQARETAHADVVKAQLEELPRTRELQDTQVEAEKARLELGVLLFPDPRTPYTLSAQQAAPPLASRQDMTRRRRRTTPSRRARSPLCAPAMPTCWRRGPPICPISVQPDLRHRRQQFSVNGPLISGTNSGIRREISATPPPLQSTSPSGIGFPPSTR